MAVREISCEQIERLKLKYYELGGTVYEEAVPGTLGWGTTIMEAEGYKTAVIQERYLNCWSCWHSIRFYNRSKVPRKYRQLMDDYPTIIEERGW